MKLFNCFFKPKTREVSALPPRPPRPPTAIVSSEPEYDSFVWNPAELSGGVSEWDTMDYAWFSWDPLGDGGGPTRADEAERGITIKSTGISQGNEYLIDSPGHVEFSSEVIDPNTGLLFDAQVDAVYFALAALNFRTVRIAVTETGWPSRGAPSEGAATPDNTNLVRRAARPGEGVDVYLFSLFNENRKPGIESEKNSTAVNGTGGGGRTWCIASNRSTEAELQSALDWACGTSGNVDCTAIQPSQPCFQPDSLASHASYAFNGYYQQNGATDVACGFGGAGLRVDKDPSYDKCIYMTAGSNKTVAINTTTASSVSASTRYVIRGWFATFVMTTLISFL